MGQASGALRRLWRAVDREEPVLWVPQRSPGLRTLAAFAYVAERYGYRYVGYGAGGAGSRLPVLEFVRLPDAARRGAAAAAAFPAAGRGGPLPGMRADRAGLRPLPEAAAEVAVAHSRMVLRALPGPGRAVSGPLALVVVLLVCAVASGFDTELVRGAGVVTGVLVLVCGTALLVTRRRRRTHTARLLAARSALPLPARSPRRRARGARGGTRGRG